MMKSTINGKERKLQSLNSSLLH